MTAREFIEVFGFRVTPLGLIYVSMETIPAFSDALPNANAFHA
jgi:hypothetical protein